MALLKNRPCIIAHRGYSECYPENTKIGIEAALQAGADGVEFDVQFIKEGVPIVIHDDTLMRTTGATGKVSQLTRTQLSNVFAGEEHRFGERYREEPVPTLESVLDLLDLWPRAVVFVEIKEEAIEEFGVEFVARKLVPILAQYGDQCVLISFNIEVLELAKRLGMKRTGWVIPRWDGHSRAQAEELAPDVLFCNYKIIPDQEDVLWPGPWQWALYDIVDPRLACHWVSRGVTFLETWDIGRLLQDQQLITVIEKKAKKT